MLYFLFKLAQQFYYANTDKNDFKIVKLNKYPDFGESKSATSKFLTKDVFEALKATKSKHGFGLDLVINSAVQNHGSSIGCYAPEPEAYDSFALFFDKIIKDYHNYGTDDKHPTNLNVDDLNGDNPDPNADYIVSTRIRVGRNMDNFPLVGGISQKERVFLSKKIVAALASLDGELKGKYYPLDNMKEEDRKSLIADHFLFKAGDKYLEAAGCNRNWPEGRGIFHSADKRFLVWVNEEDQLRIISMQKGGAIKEVFARLSKAIGQIEKKLKFAHTEHLGYITSCPTNLGTAMRASVHIRIPNISKESNFYDWCEKKEISVRGIHGEHSKSAGGIYDISNKRRLGLSEVDCVQTMYDAVVELIAWEKRLEATNEEKKE